MSNAIYRAAVKEGTFLDCYLRYVHALESPLEYDFWCGMWVLSMLAGRRIYIARPKAPVYLNLYVILCAGPATRKSTSIAKANTIATASGTINRYTTFNDSAAPGTFIRKVARADSAHVAIVVSELVRFMGREAFAMGMPGLLTDLYDCPSIRGIERDDATHTLRDVYVTFLSASTPAWLIRAVNPDVIEGGFTSRCIFVVQDKPKHRVAWPEGSDAEEFEHIARLCVKIERLRERIDSLIEMQSGAIQLTDGALARFVQWYDHRTTNRHPDPFTESFDGREDHHVLRLAALLSLNDGRLEVTVDHIDHAIKIIKLHRQQAVALFGQQSVNNKLATGIDKLRDTIAKAGKSTVSRTQLLFAVRSYMGATELAYVLSIMHELDMIQVFEVANAGRTRTEYRGTNRLRLNSLNEIMQERLFEGE